MPYPPSTAYVPDASDRRLGLRRDRCRSPVIFLFGEQRPDHARHLVGERNRDEHARLARQHPLQPRTRWCTVATGLAHHRAAADDQQSSDRSLAHLRYAAEPLLSAGLVLTRRKAKPCREVAAFAERLDRRSERDNRRRCDGSDTRDGHQPPGRIIRLCPPRDLAVEHRDLLAELAQ